MCDKKTMNSKIVSGIAWSYGERIAAQGVSFLVSIILARLLSPSEYGSIAIVTAIITLCNTLCVGGFGNAIIQKKNADERDYSTAFWFSLLLGIMLFLIIVALSGTIASIFQIPILKPVISVMALRIPISCVNTIQHSIVSRRLEFKKFFFSTIIGTIISAFVGIGMAYGGCGIWALVGQYLTNSIIDTIVLTFTLRWKPRLIFSCQSLKSLLSFGSSVLLASLMTDLTAQVRTLIVGKKYVSADLAFYNRGQQFPNLVVTNLSEVIGKVTFPVYSKLQDNRQGLSKMVRHTIQMLMIVMAPMMVGMFVVAEPVISILLTDKWLPAVPYMRLFCIYYLLYPIHSANAQAVKALGLSKAYFSRACVLNAVDLILMAVVVIFFHSPIYIAVAAVSSTLVMTMYCAYLNKKSLDYSYWKQIKDAGIPVMNSIIMGAIILQFKRAISNTWMLLLLQIIVGVVIYVVLTLLSNSEGYCYFRSTLKKLMKTAKK